MEHQDAPPEEAAIEALATGGEELEVSRETVNDQVEKPMTAGATSTPDS